MRIKYIRFIVILNFILILILMFINISNCFSFYLILVIGISILILKIVINKQKLRNIEKSYLLDLSLYSFTIKLFLITFLYIGFLGLGGDGFAFFDDRNYHYWAIELSSSWKAGKSLSMWAPMEGNPGYIYLCAFIYYLFEPNTLIARCFNSLISTLAIIYVYRISIKLFDTKTAKVASLLTAFFPPFLLWSSVQFKDVVVAFLIIYIIFQTLEIQQNLKLHSIFKYIISLIILLTIRKQYFPIMVALSLFYLVISQKFSFKRYAIGLIMLISIIFTGFITKGMGYGFLGSNLIIKGQFNVVDIRESYLKLIEEIRGGPRSSLIYLILKENIFKKFYLIPIPLIFSILNPFPPWNIKPLKTPTTLFTNIGVIANWAWIFYLLVCFIFGFYYSVKYNFKKSFLLLSTSLVILLGISLKYAGGVQRQFIPLVPFFMIFSSIGIINFPKWKKFYPFYIFILGTGFVLYLTLKWFVL